MIFLDFLTVLSYVALTADILFQIANIKHTHSVRDISLVGVTIRYGAILIIWYKFYTLADWPLLLGQTLLAVTFTLYLCLAFYYYRHKLPVTTSVKNDR